MDKRIILAVAGSGKTTYIVEHLNLENRFLLITYSHGNISNLKSKVIRKFGYIPKNIKIIPYFSFLYSFCYKPNFYIDLPAKGISYNPDYFKITRLDSPEHYINKNKRLHSNRISKFIVNHKNVNFVNNRLEKYYDELIIDEVQDIAGSDFNLLKKIVESNINILFVGDFYQHTYDTSRDGNINQNLHNDCETYKKQLKEIGLTIDTTTLSKSYRCSLNVCKFVRDNLEIYIESHNKNIGDVIFIDDIEAAKLIYKNNSIVKLFFWKHYNYHCFSKNWGQCKGEDLYKDVCVVLNKTTYSLYKKNQLSCLAKSTKNKFYVACTRASGNLYLMSDNLINDID